LKLQEVATITAADFAEGERVVFEQGFEQGEDGLGGEGFALVTPPSEMNPEPIKPGIFALSGMGWGDVIWGTVGVVVVYLVEACDLGFGGSFPDLAIGTAIAPVHVIGLGLGGFSIITGD
jgi:hypothetical protein